VELNKENVKSWYRLAKARQQRKEWELCAEACEGGLEVGAEGRNRSDEMGKKIYYFFLTISIISI
jgi:hypothetical protein